MFDPHPTVYFNGDTTLFELGQVFGDDYIAFTISFYVKDPTECIAEQAASVALWPNPAQDQVNIQAEGLQGIAVYNAMGQLVKTVGPQGCNQFTLETGDLPAGLYLLRLTLPHESLVRSVVVR